DLFIDMAAGWLELQADFRSLRDEVNILSSLQQISTGTFDPDFICQNEVYVPCERHVQVYTYGWNADGMPKCSLMEPFFLSPLSTDEKKSLKTSSHTMMGMDYFPPPVPDGVILQGRQKAWDGQLRDIQFQLGQTAKSLDYFMDLQTHSEPDPSMATALSFLVSFRRILADQASSITQTRLNNFFKFANLPFKAPHISAASAPHMFSPAVVRDLLASVEVAKKLQSPNLPEPKPARSNKKARRGRKPAPGQPPAEKEETASQSELTPRPHSSASRA
ncbi:hypothetical protein BGW41_002095, partial [Actinomortierella wolfii]